MDEMVNFDEKSKVINRDVFNEWFREEMTRYSEEKEASHIPTMSIISTKGTLDWGYPPFILASTAAAMGWDVSVFFSFYGLDLLKKDLNLEISPLGNPAMPMKMPFGPEWFKQMDWNIPNIVSSNIPGFDSFATMMMEKTLENKGVASIEELRELSIEADVKFIACQMTVDLFGYKKEDFISEIHDWIGAASFLPVAAKSDITLYV